MYKKLPLGLIALSLLSAPLHAGVTWNGDPGKGSSPGYSSGSGSHEEEFNYYRIDCRYHGQDQDGDRGSDRSSDKDSDKGKGSDKDRFDKDRFDKDRFDKDRDKDRFEKGKVFGEKSKGNDFCYGSAVYRITDKQFRNVHLAIGCNSRTIFNEDAIVHTEMTLDRFQPLRAATPAIEVFPHGQLASEGTYTSVLDISSGRMKGLCYVRPVKWDIVERKY